MELRNGFDEIKRLAPPNGCPELALPTSSALEGPEEARQIRNHNHIHLPSAYCARDCSNPCNPHNNSGVRTSHFSSIDKKPMTEEVKYDFFIVSEVSARYPKTILSAMCAGNK